MSIPVQHFITVGNVTAELTEDEARVVAKGEIPQGMIRVLFEKGIKLPERGTVTYQHEIRFPDKIIYTEAHMRRMEEE